MTRQKRDRVDGYGLVRFNYTSVSTLSGSFDECKLLLLLLLLLFVIIPIGLCDRLGGEAR